MNRLLSLFFFIQITSSAQSVNVTILVNTSTIPDTIRSTAFVQMRGNKTPLTEDSLSPVIFNRIAGDYWKVTAQFKPNDTVLYNFFVNGGRNKFSGLEGTPKRILIIGSKDTTLPLQYIFGSVQDTNQYWKPFQETDSIEVLFRVNMQLREDFNPANEKVGLVGGTPPLHWAKSIFLKRENQHGNPSSREYDGGYFWSTVVRFPKSDTTKKIEYKFVIHALTDSPTDNPKIWESGTYHCSENDYIGNRYFNLVPSMNDSTIAWKHWDNNECKKFNVYYDTLFFVTFMTNISQTRDRKMYSAGDTVYVYHGFANSGQDIKRRKLEFFGNSKDLLFTTDTVKVIGISQEKTQTVKRFYYRYSLTKNNVENQEFFPYYFYISPDPYYPLYRYFEYEKSVHPQTILLYDTSASEYPRNQPYFNVFRKLTKDVLVTINCDLRPAWHQLAIGDSIRSLSYFPSSTYYLKQKDSIYTLGVFINGDGFDKLRWMYWGDSLKNTLTRKMLDDGTHGDKTANDHIYSNQFKMYKDSTGLDGNIFQFRFGIGGYDNESINYNSYHREVVNDSMDTFTMNMQFGSIASSQFNQWNYADRKPTGIREINSQPVRFFALQQNYPNPFNPSTTITFSLPIVETHNIVSLKIYDLLGREISTLVNKQLNPGTYTVAWYPRNVPSGIYFYRLQSKNYFETKRMLLLK